jgi:hypothetical protein
MAQGTQPRETRGCATLAIRNPEFDIRWVMRPSPLSGLGREGEDPQQGEEGQGGQKEKRNREGPGQVQEVAEDDRKQKGPDAGYKIYQPDGRPGYLGRGVGSPNKKPIQR